MSVKNDSYRVAIHFIEATAGRATPAIMKKTISQAKALLQSGYTREEIISVIDHIIQEKKVNIYSLGYVNTCINDTLRHMEETKQKQEAEQLKASIAEEERQRWQSISEVVGSDNADSAERNRNKSSRFGVQPRLGEESFSDLFEGK